MKNKILEFFIDISKIPRGSGNEKEVSDYICKFAEKRNLEYYQDSYNNVIVKKKDGKNQPILLQGHLDMVCVKADNMNFDFFKNGIEVMEENGYLKAKGTSLGADNGIGLAEILTILDSNLKINVEAIFTVSEETTMIGAERIDLSSLKGNRLINLDGFDEDTIIIESAGFWDIVLEMNYIFTEPTLKNSYEINLSGMPGGHSGLEIDSNHGNSILELSKIISSIPNIELIDFSGGSNFNVIPSHSSCTFYSDIDKNDLNLLIKESELQLRKKYPNIVIQMNVSSKNEKVLNKNISRHFIDSLTHFKNGVYKRNGEYVTTSHNLGVISLKENNMKIGMRSSKKQEATELLEYLTNYSKKYHYMLHILGNQPGFETSQESLLLQGLIDSHKKISKKPVIVKPVHIGVECGFLKEKIPNLEVVIISAKILGAHSIEEKVSISSIYKCHEWLVYYLENYVIKENIE